MQRLDPAPSHASLLPLSALAGLGRGRIALAQTAGVLRGLEQEEPFDLSQKREAKDLTFQADRDSARVSPCHEDEDNDPGYEVESPSPSLEPPSPARSATHDPQAEAELAPEVPGEVDEADAADEPQKEAEANSKVLPGAQHPAHSLRLCAFPSPQRGSSFSEYLYFKHRDESLKELLERKIEKQTVLLGI